MNGTSPRMGTETPRTTEQADRPIVDHPLSDGEPELTFRLTPAEAELVLEALGAMRYSTVYRLIAKIQTQARAQVAEASGPGAS